MRADGVESRTLTVFIVEDTPIVVQVLTRALAGLNGIELCGHTGRVRDALARIAHLQPDVVILDVHLEDGSGLDLLRQFRQQPAAPVIIMFSNSAYLRAHCLRGGADHFFDKSTEFQELVATLKKLNGEHPGS
ncbi:MAG: putative transcriptional regulatory protein TcrX [Verrucomicrobiae bacterium]|nr:putative transcriptional regulatory protein TcrX [Verrucomicrobiae bacterium]